MIGRYLVSRGGQSIFAMDGRNCSNQKCTMYMFGWVGVFFCNIQINNMMRMGLYEAEEKSLRLYPIFGVLCMWGYGDTTSDGPWWWLMVGCNTIFNNQWIGQYERCGEDDKWQWCERVCESMWHVYNNQLSGYCVHNNKQRICPSRGKCVSSCVCATDECPNRQRICRTWCVSDILFWIGGGISYTTWHNNRMNRKILVLGRAKYNVSDILF